MLKYPTEALNKKQQIKGLIMSDKGNRDLILFAPICMANGHSGAGSLVLYLFNDTKGLPLCLRERQDILTFKKEVYPLVAKAIDIKKEIVTEITDKLQRSVAAIVVDYRGLKVGEVTELRRQCREQDLEYKVYKNTLARMAAKNVGMEDLAEELVGPNAILFSYEDPVAAVKVADEFAKTHKNLELKVGFIEGAFYGKEKLEEFASIPSREELIAKLLGSLRAPVSNFVRLLQAANPASNFVYLLQAMIDKEGA